MQDGNRVRPDVMRAFGQMVDRSIDNAQDRVRGAARATGAFVNGRNLTAGETRMVTAMFGPHGGYARAKIYPRNFFWPNPTARAIPPDGNIYFPGDVFEDDFSLPFASLAQRALFMHEATHLYQWYVLRQWVFLRGPFDRNYRYDLIPGQALKDYGLEQMGQIVQDYYLLMHGGAADRRYRASDYRDAVPVRPR